MGGRGAAFQNSCFRMHLATQGARCVGAARYSSKWRAGVGRSVRGSCNAAYGESVKEEWEWLYTRKDDRKCMYYRDKRLVANTAERASKTARQGTGLTRRFNDNTRMQ